MQPLWAPWRMDYILNKDKNKSGCVFCLPLENSSDDENRFVLYRGNTVFVMMNTFPYTNGHLLVVPLRHLKDLTLLTETESAELMSLITHCTDILGSQLKPQGINVGLNLGEAAGAGICDHFHFHVLPRWLGDSSFMVVCSETPVIPEDLVVTYKKLKPLFSRLSP